MSKLTIQPENIKPKMVFHNNKWVVKVEDAPWYFSDKPTVNILKWKLADDWNKVVNGQAPDIDGETLIDVVCKDEHGRFTTTTTKDGLFWDSVKKWRYAKEKKAK